MVQNAQILHSCGIKCTKSAKYIAKLIKSQPDYRKVSDISDKSSALKRHCTAISAGRFIAVGTVVIGNILR